MKLIDADKIDEYLGEWADEFYEDKENADADFMDGYCMTLNKILSSKVPKIDAVPVVHGKWVKSGRWGRVYRCDQCGNYLDFDGVNVGRGDANYCPNCGADMRGEQDG